MNEQDPPERESPLETWLQAVNEVCCRRVLVVLSDLPELDVQTAFDAGLEPNEFFEQVVLPAMRSRYDAAAIDALLDATAGFPVVAPRRRGPKT
jgi:hypothetical protein